MSAMETASYLLAVVYLINWLGLGLIAAKQAGLVGARVIAAHLFSGSYYTVALMTALFFPLVRVFGDPWPADALRVLLDGLTGDVTGHLLVAVGAAVAVMAQIQLGPRWICMPPQDGSEPLVEDGLYAASRNPGYIGQAIFAVGLFLVFPSVGQLVATLVLFGALRIRVTAEERDLRHGLPDQWAGYAAIVRRWVGRGRHGAASA